jgi:small subunit ribosomal protein S3
MGQKVHPYGIRLGIIKDWTSTWFADRRRYPDYLNTDLAVRAFLRKKLAHASVSRIQIERPANNARIWWPSQSRSSWSAASCSAAP